MSPPRKALRQTRFKNERLDPIGAELMSLAELRGRVPATQLLQTERVEFFMVLVATGGRGGHLVDFEPANGFEADVLLLDPAVVQPTASTSRQATMSLLRLEEWPVHFRMGADGLAAWRSLSAMLRRELDQPILDELSAAMARELILCLMLGISRSAAGHPSAPTAQATLIRRLRRALEERVHARPSVALLARSVGVGYFGPT